MGVAGFEAAGVDVHDVEFGVEAAGHAGGAGDEVLRGGIGADADGQAFADGPIFLDILGGHVGVEAAVDVFGDLAEGEFAQSDQIAAAEKIVEGLMDFVLRVDVAALHAALEGLGSEIDHDGFVGHGGNPVGDGFADGDSGDAADGGREAFHVLDVQGGEHIDFGGENFLDVFVALAVLAAGDVGVSKFVDEDDGGTAGDDGVDVHLFEEGAFVFDFAEWDLFELRGELDEAFAAVGFEEADDHVFAASVATNAFAEHAEGFADAGSIAEKKFEDAFGFFGGSGLLEPVFGFLRHGGSSSAT